MSAFVIRIDVSDDGEHAEVIVTSLLGARLSFEMTRTLEVSDRIWPQVENEPHVWTDMGEDEIGTLEKQCWFKEAQAKADLAFHEWSEENRSSRNEQADHEAHFWSQAI